MTIIIFGKKGCGKCGILKSRISKLLSTDNYNMFSVEAFELDDDEDVIVRFCDLECLNFSSIPSFYIEKEGVPLKPKKFNTYSLPTILGLQTDYSKGGTMTPTMIEQVLTEAKQQVKKNE